MHFDFALGNPPYQGEKQGESTTTLPVYHDFMSAVFDVADRVELITPARFLFDGGRTPKEWNQKMLGDSHFKVEKYYSDSKEVFHDVEIKGGVAISYRDRNKDFGAIHTFTQYPSLNAILKKVLPFLREGSMENIIFVATKFNMDELSIDYPQYKGRERRLSSNVFSLDCFSEKSTGINEIKILGISGRNREFRYIPSRYIDSSVGTNIKGFKVVLPKADGNGVFGEPLTNPEILSPQSGYTHTFYGIGDFKSEYEATSAKKYVTTKFARTMLDILKITQDVNPSKWKYVPVQDFSTSSDIDWTQSVHDIDQQLYKKYGLTDEEQVFIESHVKEMN